MKVPSASLWHPPGEQAVSVKSETSPGPLTAAAGAGQAISHCGPCGCPVLRVLQSLCSWQIHLAGTCCRELAEQIHKESRRFGKAYNLRMCAAFGGLSKHDQFRDLKAGSEVGLLLSLPIHLVLMLCHAAHYR